MSTGPSVTAAPLAAAPAATPALPRVPGPGASDASAGSNATLCLLGLMSECGSAAASAAPAPAADAPSSWTNITPPSDRANPSPRELPAEAYDPDGHEVVLFGGYGDSPGGTLAFLGDTWTYADDRWTELANATTCSPSTCPSARAGAMLAYDPVKHALVLFGGYITVPALPRPRVIAYNDTWAFANGTWTNLSGLLGAAPSPRFSAAMAYDPSDDDVVLFGGENSATNALGDTWTFAAGWANLTGSLGGATGYETGEAPEPREGAAVATSPSGYVLLFGGADSQEEGAVFDIIQNYCNNGTYNGTGNSTVAWWFYHDSWTPMLGWGDDRVGPCTPIIQRPTAASAVASAEVDPPAFSPPCGRYDASLGWSPKNAEFVLYGGFGSSTPTADNSCTTNRTVLNDTWLYANASGGGFDWHNAGDSGDPTARYAMGYASDLTSDYFEIFGGLVGGPNLGNASYRFYAVVHAHLTGPTEYDPSAGPLLVPTPFVLTGFGGSGDLTYTLSATGLKTGNPLGSAGGCAPFVDGSSSFLPFNGTVVFTCEPASSSYNLYRLGLTVTDAENASDQATATWIFEVEPPEQIAIYPEYVGYFYSHVALAANFTVYAEVAGSPAESLTASLGPTSVAFVQSAHAPLYWNATIAMASVPAGAVLAVNASWGDWSQNATYAVDMVAIPGWLAQVFAKTGANQTIVPNGSGPFNKTYTVDEAYSWDLGRGMNFSLPNVPLLGGTYDLIPSMTVVFALTSFGALTIDGTLPLDSPQIDLGPVAMGIDVSFTLTGAMQAFDGSVQWLNATAEIAVDANVGASVPIVGFDILGVTVGFTLQVAVNVSAALTLLLTPSTASPNDILGIGLMIQQFLGSLSVALSAGANFGIGIASVGLGASLGIAFAFAVDPDLAIRDGWLNGSIYATASFFWYSESWDLASGTLATFTAAEGPEGAAGPTYDNGSDGSWGTVDRYYNTSAYDAVLWNPSSTSGPAVADVYPYAELSGASAYNGADLFLTYDNVSRPVADGLGLEGYHLDAGTNALTALPAPDDPGYVLANPRAGTLEDGDLYVLWAAVPLLETGAASPSDLGSIALQGASFDPVTDSWGPVHTYSAGGFAQSYDVDATAGAPEVVELESAAPILNAGTAEQLVTYALGSGRVLANVSVVNLSEVEAFRSGLGVAVVEPLSGAAELINLSTGAPVPVGPFELPSGDVLAAQAFVVGSEEDVVLTFTGPSPILLVYDLANRSALAVLPLGPDDSDGQGIAGEGAVYLFVRTASGLEGWVVSGGKVAPYATIVEPNVQSYGLAESAGSLVVYALAANGTAPQPEVNLTVTELGASLLPVPRPAAAQSAAPGAPDLASYVDDLALAAGVVAFVLAVLAGRRRRPTRPTFGSPGPDPASDGAAPPPRGGT